ncbi:MAG: ABC transporter substrate-binding protein [Bryobacteraceae bacterium]
MVRSSAIPRVAFVQHVSQKVFDDAIQGMNEALAEEGLTDGQTIALQAFNAEGDVGTGNTIAKQVSAGGYDMIITMSTLSLQSVANANKDGKTRHVFGLVSDPSIAGVGISRANPLDHPKHLAGLGTMQPVENAFRTARIAFPGLKKVGVAWNATEANSEATVKIARAVSKDIGIELLETNVDSSPNVGQAAEALIGRGAQAIWVGGDLTVMVAVDAVIGAARRAHIPVFSNTPDFTKKGAIFDLGANYHQVGYDVGKMAASVLKGQDTAAIPIRNVVPEKLFLNRSALKGLKDNWSFPEDLVAKAAVVIDDQGEHSREQAPAPKAISKLWKLRLVQLNNAAEVEETEHGLREGLLTQKLAEGRDYEFKTGNAQADMATLNSLVDAALSENADLIVTFSTPTLQVALRKVEKTPVVYTYVATGLAAGVGRSRTDHRKNFTGVDVMGAYPEMVTLIKTNFPKIKRIGTLYSPAEANMIAAMELLEDAAKKAGIEVVGVPVNASTEVSDAALALTAKGVDAIVQVAGNITAISFGSILQAANKAKVPTFAFTKPQALAGAPVTLARDYEESGRLTAAIIARIMRGENPQSIPIQMLNEDRLMVNMEGARAIGLEIPDALAKRADQVIGQ